MDTSSPDSPVMEVVRGSRGSGRAILNDAYGGWNCPWTYGTGGYGASYNRLGNTTAKGTKYRNNRVTAGPRTYRGGTYCAYGPRYGW